MKALKKLKINKLFLESSTYIILSFAQKGLSFILVPFYTFFLSTEEFGLVNQIVSLHAIYIVVITFSLNETIAKGMANVDPKDVDKVKINIVVPNLLMVALGAILLFSLKWFFYDEFLGELDWLHTSCSIVIVMFTPIFFIYQKFLIMQRKPMFYAKTMISFVLIQIILSLVFIYIFDLGSLGYILTLAVNAAIYGVLSYSKLLVFNSSLINKEEIKNHLSYSLKLVPHGIFGWGINGFTNVALGNMISVSAVGILNAVNVVGVFVNVVSKAILDAFQPWIYEQLRTNKGDATTVKNIVRILSILMVIMGIFLMSVDDLILKIVLNKNYHGGIKYAPFLILNSVIIAIGSMTVYVIYFYENKVKFVSISTIIGAVINMSLGYFLIKEYELMGAITALIIANFIINLIKSSVSSRIIKKSYNLLELWIIIYLVTFVNYLYDEYAIYLNVFLVLYLLLRLYLILRAMKKLKTSKD